ncbi:MAG: S41 family peptidase [Chlorobi bacterium]|nr:S41 family peptidase [Chlorobiota bacterium]
MEYKNSKRAIYTPIIIALILVAGMFIGRNIFPQKTDGFIFTTTKKSSYNDKIDAILQLIHNNYVEKISIDSLTEIAIPQILHNLDPHTSYLPSKVNEEAHESLDGNFDGIGVQFNIQNDTVMIINTISGGPSAKIGVLAGDRIVTVNDSLIAGVGITNNGVMKILKGPAGSKVRIAVKRKGIKDLIDFEIIRGKIPLYSVDVSYMLNKNTGYIKISRFAGTTYAEFMKAAEKLKAKGMTELVMDLRDNGGGYLNEAVNIADEFLPAGKMIVFTKGAFRKRTEYKSTGNNELIDIKLAILINSWTASASEIVSGAIQDNDRGIIVGRRSFGKGLVQEEFDFKDHSGVRITTARYYTPVGRCIQKSYKDGYENYYTDIYKRAYDGELLTADSTKFPDSLKYTTPGGKIVYGGGGIMPDYFVPVDTSGVTPFYRAVTKKGLIYKFALTYADNHRKELQALKNYEKINNFLNEKNVLKQFTAYAAKQDITHKNSDLKLSGKIINTRLKAYIARNIIDNDGYYPIIREIDTDLKKATEILNENK